jgi:DNA repair ATPase RecN
MKSNIEKVYSKLPKTELATQKVELKVGDELKGLAAKVISARDSVYKDLDNSFTPIRQIERLVDEIPDKIDGFKEFSNALQKMELQFQKDTQKVKDFENELGVKIDRPKSLDAAVKSLEEFQSDEEYIRKDINEFNQKAKKYR